MNRRLPGAIAVAIALLIATTSAQRTDPRILLISIDGLMPTSYTSRLRRPPPCAGWRWRASSPTTDLALFILKTFDPHVMLLHLFDLDDSAHTFGPGSPEDIVVVSDHGFLRVKTMVQPNAAFKREGLLSVDDRGAIVNWQASFHSSGGSGFVYLKDPAHRERVRDVLMALKKDPANGIREVWTRADLDKKGAHPEAAFGLDVLDGFYTGGGHDAVVKPSTSKGGHGFAPDRPALHASFIAAGPSVTRRGSLGVIRMTQIAPTLAACSASRSRRRPPHRSIWVPERDERLSALRPRRKASTRRH